MDKLILFSRNMEKLTESEFEQVLTEYFDRFERRSALQRHLFAFFRSEMMENRVDALDFTNQTISTILEARRQKEHTRDVIERTARPAVGAPSPSSNDKQQTLPSITDEPETNTFNTPTSNYKGSANDEEEQLKPNCHNNRSKASMTLHRLPTALIGECASYLYFDSYHHLLKCCRSLYIGCTSPITLRSLHKRIFNRNSIIHSTVSQNQHMQLARFQHLTHLGIDVTNWVNMPSIHNVRLFRRLTSLSLHNSNQFTMSLLMQSFDLDFNQITSLRVHNYSIDWTKDASRACHTYCKVLTDALCRFPRIKYLELRGIREVTTLSKPCNLHPTLNQTHFSLSPCQISCEQFV